MQFFPGQSVLIDDDDVLANAKVYSDSGSEVLIASDIGQSRVSKKYLKDGYNKKILLIYRGLPGSGKSTAAGLVQKYGEENNLPVYHFEADNFFVQPDGSYKWYAGGIAKAHEVCQDMTDEALKLVSREGGIVVVSNTFTTHRELRPYLLMHETHEVPLRVVTFGTTLSLEALEKRNVHSVPMLSLERMKSRWQTYQDEIVIS